MYHDTSDSHIPNDDGDNAVPQNQGELKDAHQVYMAAYIQSLPLPLRDAVIRAFDVVMSPRESAPTTEEIELVTGEAGRVLRYLSDVSIGVYDDTPDGFMPELGHNDPCYFTGPTDDETSK